MRHIPIIVTLFILTSVNVSAQEFGMSGGFSSETALYADVIYKVDANSFYFGGSFQFANTLGDVVSEEERAANYGRTVDGSGKYFWTVDFGYNYNLKSDFLIGGEISFGLDNEFTNYEDNRFSEGGYHMIDEKTLLAGIGVNGGYKLSKSTAIFIGFNTIRRTTFGIHYMF